MVDDGVSLTTVELAHGSRPFDLPETLGINRVRLRTHDLMWRKENLTDIGFASIPDWRYGAAIDGDMLFHDPNWAVETLHTLQLYGVAQISTSLIWLGPNDEIVGTARSFVSWAAKSRLAQREQKFYNDRQPIKMLDYGYTGGAWAYRRSAYEGMGGLLDICPLGAADFHMAYALFDAPDLLLTDNDYTPQYRSALSVWKTRANGIIAGNVGVVPVTMYHLWHGPLKSRRYSMREQILIRNKYRPDEDTWRSGKGLLHLAENKPRLRDDIRDYFAERNEDSVDV